MRYLVTGGLGFIGSNFIRYILEKYSSAEVINLDALKYGSNPNNLKDIDNYGRYQFIKGDIADDKLITRILNDYDIDVIVNFAAESHVDRSISNPVPFLKSNTNGTFVLLDAVRRVNKDIRFIHISTDEVYGDIVKGSFREEDRLKPSSPYSASKAAAEMFVMGFVRTYGIDSIITRCTNNFGPYQFPEKLIPKTIIRAKMNLKIPIYGTGENVRDWLYVLDHCEAIDMIIKKGKKGEVYNIAGGNERTNIQVVRKILELLNKSENLIEFVEDRPGHDLRYSIDSTKIQKIGWRPKYKFEEALKNTVHWYLRNEWWWKPLINEKILHPTPWKTRW